MYNIINYRTNKKLKLNINKNISLLKILIVVILSINYIHFITKNNNLHSFNFNKYFNNNFYSINSLFKNAFFQEDIYFKLTNIINKSFLINN